MSLGKFEINQIGIICQDDEEFFIKLGRRYRGGLQSLEGFSHIQLLWWAHLADTSEDRKKLLFGKIFKQGPDQMGVFSTRAPARPNPIMSSIIKIKSIDYKEGIIYTSFIDAEENSPVLDIKPYYPMERVKECQVPIWCQKWPAWYEETIGFDWKDVINFRQDKPV